MSLIMYVYIRTCTGINTGREYPNIYPLELFSPMKFGSINVLENILIRDNIRIEKCKNKALKQRGYPG